MTGFALLVAPQRICLRSSKEKDWISRIQISNFKNWILKFKTVQAPIHRHPSPTLVIPKINLHFTKD